MRITNTTLRDLILNYRTGVQVTVPAGAFVIRPIAEVDLIDDSTAQLALFSSGQLVLANDDGGTYTGPALPALARQPGGAAPVTASGSGLRIGTVAAAAGASLRTRQPLKALSVGLNAGTANGAPGWTSHMLMSVDDEFTHVRLALYNLEAGALTNVKAAVAQTDGATSKITPSNGAWVNVTFAGAATVTLPARVSASEPSITLSDWMPLKSIARADGGLQFLAMGRVFIPSENATFSATASLNAGAFDAIGSWQSRQNVDGVTTPANFTSTAEGTTVAIQAMQFRTPARKVVGLFVGDSLTAGFGATVQQRDNWVAQAAAAAGIVLFNGGWNGQTTTQYLARLKSLLTSQKPSFVVFSVGSTNDGTPTANIINTEWANAIDAAATCDAAGVPMILTTGIPRNTYDATADGFRRELNARVRASGIPYIDFDAVMSDGASPARIIEGLYSDDRHPNNAGYAVMAQAAIPVLSDFARALI